MASAHHGCISHYPLQLVWMDTWVALEHAQDSDRGSNISIWEGKPARGSQEHCTSLLPVKPLPRDAARLRRPLWALMNSEYLHGLASLFLFKGCFFFVRAYEPKGSKRSRKTKSEPCTATQKTFVPLRDLNVPWISSGGMKAAPGGGETGPRQQRARERDWTGLWDREGVQ